MSSVINLSRPTMSVDFYQTMVNTIKLSSPRCWRSPPPTIGNMTFRVFLHKRVPTFCKARGQCRLVMETSSAAQLCRVGYALNAKKLRRAVPVSGEGKSCNYVHAHGQSLVQSSSSSSGRTAVWRGGGLADILEIEPSAGELVQFLPWDPEQPIDGEPDFHVIIHKLTEDIDGEGTPKLKALQDYLLRHPLTVIVDPIPSVRKVVSRARTCHHLKMLEDRLGGDCPFRQPSHFSVPEEISDEAILGELTSRKISFPLICKPIEACGTPQSHSMVVVISPKDVHMVPRPCIVQQYHDHGGYFFKVYVIDESVSVYVRPSLPDVQSSSADCRSLVFDSRRCYPTLESFLLPLGPITPRVSYKKWQPATHLRHLAEMHTRGEDVGTNDVYTLAHQHMRATAQALREEFKISLFGFDVILPDAQVCAQKPMVIDVNYFPSYKEVADFPQRLRRYLRSLAFKS